VTSGLADNLARQLGPHADQMRRWGKGARMWLEFADWEDRGNTAARVMAVYITHVSFTGKAIMKYVPAQYKETDEAGRHTDAWNKSPPEFRERHLVRQLWDAEPVADGAWVIFQDVAGRSLTRTRSLATLVDQLRTGDWPEPAQVSEATAIMVASALEDWNAAGLSAAIPRPSAAQHLRALLADRLGRGHPFRAWAQRRGLLTGSGPEPEVAQCLVAGQENPFALVLGSHPASARSVYLRRGLAHGDLHPGNVLFDRDLGEFWFIDLSRFGTARPLAFDLAYLLLTTTAQVLPDLGSDEQSHAATLLLAASRGVRRPRLWLPESYRMLVEAIQVAGEEWADRSNVADEWHEELLLSFVAGGLIMASRRPESGDGAWFLKLATQAADRYAESARPAEPQVEPQPLARSVAMHGMSALPRRGPDPLPYAVPRPGLLAALRARHVERPGIVVAVHGPPGSGKTQLAVAYIETYGGEYAGVTWLSGETPELLAEQFTVAAGELGVPPGRDLDAMRSSMATAMGERGRWLMVFDNMPTAAAVRPFLCWTAQVDVLVTSRSQHWSQLGATLEVGGFERPESVALLASMLSRQPGIEELAEALADLPAAVAQAAHFLAEAPVTVARFRELVRTRTTAALERGATDAYGAALATVWESALNQLTADQPAAAELVTLCAFFGPAPIPFDVLATAAAQDDQLRLAELARPATSAGLVSVSGQALRCYPLLQAFVRERTADPAGYRRAMWAGLAAQDPGDPREPRNWPRLHALLPHVLAADLVEAGGFPERRLVLAAVRYLVARADLDTPLHLVRAALARWRASFGPDSEPVMEAMVHLAHVHFQRGEYAAAVDLDQQVLEHERTRFGVDAPETLVAERNVAASRAAAWRHQGGPGPDGGPLSGPVAERQREVLGPEHPDTLRSAVNLAYELRAAGHRHRARDVAEVTYRRMATVLGARHLDTLLCAHGLALDLRESGEHEAARRLNEEVHAARLELHGPDHPDTAQSAVSLATDLRRAGEIGRARQLDAEAYAALSRALGTDHPLTLLAAHGLATDHERLGDLHEAVRLAEDTYTRRRHVLGQDDVATLRSTNLLARLLEANGHPDRAAPLLATLRRYRLRPPA